MTNTRSLKQGFSKVFRHWRDNKYDLALDIVEELLKSWPGNSRLHILWASLVQLQDRPSHQLDEVKKAFQRAMELDKDSPAAAVELGHFLDAVEDDPQAASKVFAEGTLSARRLLIDGLLGQARALLQMDKRDEALKCLMESLYLADIERSAEEGKSPNGTPDVLLRDATGRMLAFQLKGPFAIRVEDLLEELLPQRSA
jgi:tetratricopeptide (TPR) repeat protein